MDVLARIDELMKERGWSDYKLATESNLSSSTVANFRRRNTVPSVSTIESICNAFGITLAQFFADETSVVQLTGEQMEMFRKWIGLTKNQKRIVDDIINEFK
ncbi:MAG: helix-turn-helix transcriptional regulator [Lachnospiraceae bacterium]|nr:helix-turn-helix transcriptional regulator [Lachnospiraceae bacterium]